MFLFVSITLALNARDASGVTIYRIGQPFSAAERDSLEGIGIELRELDWSLSVLEDALDPDSAGQDGPLPGAIRHRCQRPGVPLL